MKEIMNIDEELDRELSVLPIRTVTEIKHLLTPEQKKEICELFRNDRKEKLKFMKKWITEIEERGK